ncbi:MAG TPA: DUF5131 family protein [Polyangiaceae bacterium]|jgi:protein gp37|nr:DUF5131 family protein [Polyangiaceae bacterium]
MRYYLDTEFCETGYARIDLISLALVSEDGREFYAVASDGWDEDAVRAMPDDWLAANVLPHLGNQENRISRAGVMAACPGHTFQVLTKRTARMWHFFEWAKERAAHNSSFPVALFAAHASQALGRPTTDLFPPLLADWPAWPIPNIWLGASVENQEYAEQRVPLLAKIPSAVRFLSCEPLLGPLDFRIDAEATTNRYGLLSCPNCREWGAVRAGGTDWNGEANLRDCANCLGSGCAVDWVIGGGESGQRARPSEIAWARSLRDQCREVEISFFMKQLGSNVHGEWGDDNAPTVTVDDITSGKLVHVSQLARHKNGRWRLQSRKGGDMAEWPSDLRVREFPEVTP